MMSSFLANNRAELIARCKTKVASRPRRAATDEQLSNGIPLFLAQLQRTLEAEGEAGGGAQESLKISGDAGGGSLTVSEMGVSATAHGKDLLTLGFSIDQVVHDYGDLCQAITDLAFERDAPFAIDEFRTLNRCLDNAIASAVSAFSSERDAFVARMQDGEVSERVSVLMHEISSSLATASYAMAALEQGNLPASGSTGAVLKRSLVTMNAMVSRSLAEVRGLNAAADPARVFSLALFITDAKNTALLYAKANGCQFTATPIDSALKVSGDRARLLAALETLLHNAFKFTRPNTEVALIVRSDAAKIYIDVNDHCGGLAPGYQVRLFKPFAARTGDGKTALGFNLHAARASVEADAGALEVQDLPAIGCIFTITLPRSD